MTPSQTAYILIKPHAPGNPQNPIAAKALLVTLIPQPITANQSYHLSSMKFWEKPPARGKAHRAKPAQPE
jgi:hypothetical protein